MGASGSNSRKNSVIRVAPAPRGVNAATLQSPAPPPQSPRSRALLWSPKAKSNASTTKKKKTEEAEKIEEQLIENEQDVIQKEEPLPDQHTALAKFFRATDGDGWRNQDGWQSPDAAISSYYGVIYAFEKVIGLGVTDNSLGGKLPPDMGDLRALQYMYAANNNIGGTLPDSICKMTSVCVIELNGNMLEGQIPDLSPLQSLFRLELGRNRLSGKIPKTIGNLSQLQELHLGWNSLEGEIPKEIAKLKKLHTLYVNANRLSGMLPKDMGGIGSLPALYNLDVSDNVQLGGAIGVDLSLARPGSVDCTGCNQQGRHPGPRMATPYLAGASMASENLKDVIDNNRAVFWKDPSVENGVTMYDGINRVCKATSSFEQMGIIGLTRWLNEHPGYLSQHRYATAYHNESDLGSDSDEEFNGGIVKMKDYDISANKASHVPWQAEWVDSLNDVADTEQDIFIVCHTEEFKAQFLDHKTFMSEEDCIQMDFDPTYMLSAGERAYNIRDWERRIIYDFTHDDLNPTRTHITVRYVDVHGNSPLGSCYLQPSWYKGTARGKLDKVAMTM